MAYNGTVVGTPTFAAAKFSNGLTLVNDDNYLTLPAGAFNFGSTFTVELWLKDGTAALKAALSWSVNAGWIGTGATGTATVAFTGTGDFATEINSGVDITDGNWHHIAVSVTAGTSAKVFVDGTLTNTVTGVLTLPGPTATGWIGRLLEYYTYCWPGDIDEIAIWDTAKYSSSFTPATGAYTGSESGLRALYHLEADGTDSKAGITVSAATPVVGEYGPTTVALAWAAATGGTGPYTYQVQRAPDSSGSPGTFADIGDPQSGLTYLDTGRTAETKYWYRVVATDDNDLDGTSDNATITTLATGAKYNRLDGVGAGTGKTIMLLVPNANAAIPYAGAVTPLLMFHHGSGGDYDDLTTEASIYATRDALLDAGYVVAAVGAGNHWGNQAGVDAYTDLYLFADTRYNLGATLLWAGSMGALSGLQSVSQNNVPAIAAIALIAPACNLAAIYGAGMFTSAIDTAHGCNSATYAAKTNGHDPYLKWGKAFRNVSMRFYASSADTMIIKTANTDLFQALIAGSSPESAIVVCTGEHGDASHYQPSDLVAFYGRALASPPATTGIGIFVID